MAVLAFLHSTETCKISTMKLYFYLPFCMLIRFLYAENQTAEEILLKTFHRMDGINYSFKMDSEQSGKKRKEKHFHVSVHYPYQGLILRQTRVVSIDSTRKKPSSFWEQRFRDETRAKRWMSLPITGKLKDVSDKKSRKDGFSFAELEITDDEIKTHTNTIYPQEKIDTLDCYVIESTKYGHNGNTKETKKLWIDIENHLIMKVEF